MHSECLTGDILGSLRCDCGEQLQMSMSKIAIEGKGVIIYLRQEGRGIGLAEKLKTYNLQDSGMDTLDANLALGHYEDERTYEIAAHILKTLQIKSLRLLTNNPNKIEALSNHNVCITDRVSLKGSVHSQNAFYLLTKIKRMRHFSEEEELRELFEKINAIPKRYMPLVTLSYAQSLDGTISISREQKKRLILSSKDSMVMTHQLRAQNDAILVGIGTIIADDPLLTVRYCKGKNPQIVILDSKLRIPLDARILKNPTPPLIFTTKKANPEKQEKLAQMHAKIISLEPSDNDRIDLVLMLEELYSLGIKTLMVEGGREVITSFIHKNFINKVIITISPIFVGGISVLSKEMKEFGFPQLKNIIQYKLGNDVIIIGDVERKIN